MLWIKSLHIIFMVTWFAGLRISLSGHRPSWPGPESLRAAPVRTRSHSLRSRAAIPGRQNSPR